MVDFKMSANQTWRENLAFDLLHRSAGLIVLESATMIVINIFAAFGNTLFCLAILKTPSLQNKTNLYITVLAISDTLKATIVMPLTLGVLLKGKWVFGYTACQVQGFVNLSSSFGALQTMSLIALNRYFCVVRPQLYRKWFGIRSCIVMLVCAWLISFLMAAVPVMANIGSFIFGGGRSCCWISIPGFTPNISYTVSALLLFIVLPFVVIITSYVRVFRRLHTHAQNLASHQNNGITTISNRDIKITKQIFVLIVGFGACWIPCIIIELIDSFLPGGALSRGTYMTYIYFGYLSSAINPVLYGIMSRSFKAAFLNALCFKTIQVYPTSISNEGAKNESGNNRIPRQSSV